MSADPLVSVITPTWQRHELLLSRCIPSVQAQTYPNVEHLIISDGPDPELAEILVSKSGDKWKNIRFRQMDVHCTQVQHTAAPVRNAGLAAARGEFIAYLDDDDAYRPQHLGTLLAALLTSPWAGFAYSQMCSHRTDGDATIGLVAPPCFGMVGTPMIMHRASLETDWLPAGPAEDWELVQRWMNVGTEFVHVEETTVDVWPSAFWGT
jgi:cellulose synthase/poly-beta-1,6-N-acetylglucosamine synthase-like glycosyltransferase